MPALLLLYLVAASPADRLVYDEAGHLETIHIAKSSDWKTAMLETPSAAGPIYPLVHYAFSPVTGLGPVPLRLLNLCFAAIAISLVYALARLLGYELPGLCAGSMLAIPFLWPVFGMALTETLSMTCLLGFCWMTMYFLTKNSARMGEIALGFGSGTMLALACLTRQTNLVALAGMGALPFRWRSVRFGVLAVVLPLAAVGWLVSMWGGLVPPRSAFVSAGLRPDHLLIAFAYLGMAGIIVAPRFFLQSKAALAISAAGGLISFITLPINIAPARSLTERLLSPFLFGIYERAAEACLVAISILCLSMLILSAWDERRNHARLFLSLTLGAIACTPIVISHGFSSRYVTGAVPLLILLLWPHVRVGAWMLLRTAAGAVVGAGMLASYYR